MNSSLVWLVVVQVVPEEHRDEFYDWFLKGMDTRVRSAYLTWQHNKNVTARKARDGR